MASYLEALYTDAMGRELFRELFVDTGCGLPTAVRHRDGCVYVLVAEARRRAVYCKALTDEMLFHTDAPGAVSGAQSYIGN